MEKQFDGEKKGMYVIFDCKAEYYKPPFVMRSKGEVIRAFTDLCNDKESAVGQHPEDYILYHIADWYESTGQIDIIVPVSLGKAIDYKKITPALSVQS